MNVRNEKAEICSRTILQHHTLRDLIVHPFILTDFCSPLHKHIKHVDFYGIHRSTANVKAPYMILFYCVINHLKRPHIDFKMHVHVHTHSYVQLNQYFC